jgi:putative flippase GtrA
LINENHCTFRISKNHLKMSEQKFSFNYLWSLVPDRLRSLIKFGITGTSGLFIDFFLTWLFKDQFHFNPYVANSIGFTAAVLSNYFINRLWTFNESKARIGKQLTAFTAVSLVGLLLNSGFIYLFTTVFTLNFYVSKALAVVLVFFWNFTANYFFVFKASEQQV